MRERLAREVSPRGEVVLGARDDGGVRVLELRVNGVFVMDTAQTASEERLAQVALDAAPEPSRVLVGGLGLGFTARRVLADARVRRLVVVEIEPAVVRWLREGLVPGGPQLLADPRLEVVVADVQDVLAAAGETVDGETFDLVLLDVDNGPGHLVHEANATVYEADLLARAGRRLTPGGVLALWSADRAPALLAALGTVLHDAVETPVPVDLQGRAETYWLYSARPGAAQAKTSET